METKTQNFGEWFREVFDLNNDGKVTLKEFFAVLVPNHAVAISLLVVDLLALVAEYRVWDVGVTLTHDPYKALGFVLVSIVPFYLAQILWLYPRANIGQQIISVLILVAALYTSAVFGTADLSKSYDVTRLVNVVIRLTVGYILGLLVYVLIDKGIRLQRARVQARDTAAYQKELNSAARSILGDMRLALEEEKKLRNEFGDEAVDAHMEFMHRSRKKQNGNNNNNNKSPALPPQQHNHPHWETDALLKKLGLAHEQGIAIISNHSVHNPDEFYQWLKPYGIEQVDISRKNFSQIYGQLRGELEDRGWVVNPQTPPPQP